MQSLIPLLALAAPGSFVLTALLSLVHGGPRPRLLERATIAAAFVGLLSALVASALVATQGTLATSA
ncbi:MAG: hypothetical protein AAGA56_22900, partial [Myxococcota bacterium]